MISANFNPKNYQRSCFIVIPIRCSTRRPLPEAEVSELRASRSPSKVLELERPFAGQSKSMAANKSAACPAWRSSSIFWYLTEAWAKAFKTQRQSWKEIAWFWQPIANLWVRRQSFQLLQGTKHQPPRAKK